MKLRKALLAIIGTGGLLLAVTPVASATSLPAGKSAARFAASATSYQNATIARALARYPGGTRISASQVEWDHGRMIAEIPASSHTRVSLSPDLQYGNCYYSYSCVYSGTGWGGFIWECASSYLNGGAYFCPIYNVGFGGTGKYEIHSWVNYTAYRAWLQENNSHTNPGNEYCETPRIGDNNPTYNGNFQGVNDQDGWIWMSNNSAGC
jgi:hypothetical protein